MGCRRFDLGGLADRGGTRRGHSPVALDTRHALRDPALHRARHILNDYLRLKAALDRLQSTSVATSIRETTGRRLHRFSWINEWRELADASGTPLGIELIPAGLVLCRRARRRPGADHRPGLFPLEGRHRTLAVPLGTQARRAAGTRLAIRLPAPLPQVGQRGLSDFALRPARLGGAAVVARLRPRHRADAGRQHRAADSVPPTARG